LTDLDGTSRQTRTSSFGYHLFEDVQAGGTYIVSVISKRYQSTPHAVQVNDNVGDVDFIASP